MPQAKLVETIPNRKLSIRITLTNGKRFPDGKDYAIFNCNSTAVGDNVFGGGFTADVAVSKNNDLLNSNAHVTILGIPEEWRKSLYKLQQMTGIPLYENYIQIYAGYQENDYDLSTLIYQGQLETVQPDRNGGLDATVIVSKGIFDQRFNTKANPVSVDGAEKLTSLFDRIINQSLNPVDAVTVQRVYKLTNMNVLCAKNESLNQNSVIEQLIAACLHNNCYPPNISHNIITIYSKDYDKILESSDDEPILTLDENNIIGYLKPGSGTMQRYVTIRYSERCQVRLLQKIQIVGDYDDIDTQQSWYINSLDYNLQNRGEKWEVTLGLGSYAYNIMTSSTISTSNSSNPPQTESSFLLSAENLTAGLPADAKASIQQRQENAKIAPLGEMQSASTNLGNTINYWFNNAKKFINTGFPAKIIKADNEKNRYTIQSLLQILNYNGTLQQPLVVKNVPAFCPKFTQIEFEEGDVVRVHCDQYYTADIYDNQYTVQPQRSPRRLSASDCVITDYAQDLNDSNNVVKYKKGSMKARFEDEVNLQVGDDVTININKNDIIIKKGNNSNITVKSNEIDITSGSGKVVIKNNGDIEIGSGILSKVLVEGKLGISVGSLNLTGVQPWSNPGPPTPIPCAITPGATPNALTVTSGGSSKVKASI